MTVDSKGINQGESQARLVASMCMTCGCMIPNDRHGNKRYIIYDDLEAASKADKATVDDTIKNIMKTYRAIKKGKVKVGRARK